MLLVTCTCALAFTVSVGAFSRGAPDFSCKDPSTFHTRKVNATHEGIIMPGNMSMNPYSVQVEVLNYGPGDKITVTMKSDDASRPLRGFFLQAVQGNIHLRDLRRRAFGIFENTTADERPSVCQAFGSIPTSGITHSNARGKQSISVTWIAPVEYNPGDIQFLATGVLDYYTYWTDIRSPTVISDGYPIKSENSSIGQYTPTAAWFRWLQYLRQHQLLLQNLGLPTTTTRDSIGAGTRHMEVGHDHHHHDHDHAHDHVINMTSQSTIKQDALVNETLTLSMLLEEHINATDTKIPAT